MTFRKLEFENADGFRLAARLDLPRQDKPAAYAVFAHCFTCTKNIKAAHYISRALTEAGLAVMRFDFTGLGESEGDFADTNFSSNIEDLVAAARFLETDFEPPGLLIGHSLGGAAVLRAALDLPSVKAVVSIAAPADPGHVTLALGQSARTIAREGRAEVELQGRRFTIKKQFLDDLKSANLERTLGRLNRALLVLHSPVDAVVGIENAGRIFQAARHPRSFISLHEADHLLSDPADSRYAGRLIAAWSSRYLTAAEEGLPHAAA